MRDIYLENLYLRLEKVNDEIREILFDLEAYKKETKDKSKEQSNIETESKKTEDKIEQETDKETKDKIKEEYKYKFRNSKRQCMIKVKSKPKRFKI